MSNSVAHLSYSNDTRFRNLHLYHRPKPLFAYWWIFHESNSFSRCCIFHTLSLFLFHIDIYIFSLSLSLSLSLSQTQTETVGFVFFMFPIWFHSIWFQFPDSPALRLIECCSDFLSSLSFFSPPPPTLRLPNIWNKWITQLNDVCCCPNPLFPPLPPSPSLIADLFDFNRWKCYHLLTFFSNPIFISFPPIFFVWKISFPSSFFCVLLFPFVANFKRRRRARCTRAFPPPLEMLKFRNEKAKK